MSDSVSQRPTRALISLDNLAFNFHSSKRFIGEGPEVMGVVKANAYGHGAVACARRLEAEGIDWLAVAIPEEAIELRDAGVGSRLLCLGGFWSGQEAQMIERHITPVIFKIEMAELLNRSAREKNVQVAVHVKVDSGMGRVGILPSAVSDFAQRLKSMSHLKLEGIMTHFAVADDLSQTEFTENQIAVFNESVERFRSAGHSPKYTDLANSPGAVAHPSSRSNLVRLGGILYGLGGDVLPKEAPAPELKPVMRLETRIADIKEFPAGSSLGYGRTFITERPSRIATIPIGYHDGLPRVLSNIGQVLIKGTRVPIAGRVSMDWTILDVTDLPDCSINDVVTIIGRDGAEAILAEDLAIQTDTISYEITCGVGQRVPRIYDQG